MKKSICLFLLNVGVLFFSQQNSNGVGISRDHSHIPHEKAIFDVKSPGLNKVSVPPTGVLVPRLTQVQINAIVTTSLQNGLLVYNKDTDCFNYYSSQKTKWEEMCGIKTP